MLAKQILRGLSKSLYITKGNPVRFFILIPRQERGLTNREVLKG